MPSYILRNIDPDLWARVKARSEKDGIPMRTIIFALLEHYVEHGVTLKATIPARKK